MKTVGRSEDNGFQIPEGSISSRHCELATKGEEVLIKDLGSTNGTFLDDKKITEATMKMGQVLRLGSVELRFEGDKEACRQGGHQDHHASARWRQTRQLG